MFNWFRPSRNKCIFRFWDGSRWTGVDPIEAFRKLDAHPEFDWESIGPRIDAGEPEALRIVCSAVQDAFGVQPWSMDRSGRESGLSTQEHLELLTAFSNFVVDVKKNINLFPTSRQPTAATSPDSTTKPTADSGSIAPEPI